MRLRRLFDVHRGDIDQAGEIAVSNTNVHLRAGVGKASRLLIPVPPEYRWMAQGDGSPWFPGCKLYRQDFDRSWDQALASLAADLAG